MPAPSGATLTRWRALLDLYLTRYGELPVAGVESPFQVELEDPDTGEVVGRPLKGYLDLILANRTAIELKTSSKGWSDFDLVRHLQIGAYAFALNAVHGSPSALEVHVLVRLKKEPRVETFRIERAVDATRWWFEAARSIEAAISGGHFPPKPSPLCRDCEYEKACAAWTLEEPGADSRRRLPVIVMSDHTSTAA